MSFSTMSSTLDFIRKDNFRTIQAEQAAESLLKKHQINPKTTEVFEFVKAKYLEKPTYQFSEKAIEELRQKALPVKAEVVIMTAPIAALSVTKAELEKNLTTMTAALGTSLSDMISVPLCWSSRRMTELMNWRNPQVEAKPTVLRSIINITKRAVTEVALPFLAVTAAVETLATGVLMVGARALQPLSKRPLNYLNSTRVPGINQSARFTALWTVANLYHNVREKALPILELDARNILFKGYFKL